MGYKKDLEGNWAKSKKRKEIHLLKDENDHPPHPPTFSEPTALVPPPSPLLASSSHHVSESSHPFDDIIVHGIANLRLKSLIFERR